MVEVYLEIDSHQWAQKLPLTEGRFICMTCDQVVDHHSKMKDAESCAAAYRRKTGNPHFISPDEATVSRVNNG